MSYRLDLIGTDGKTATETHELVQATEPGLFIRDGHKETWIPWGQIHVASITGLDAGEVRQPEVRVVRPRPQARRRGR